jgi:hypothetical protein
VADAHVEGESVVSRVTLAWNWALDKMTNRKQAGRGCEIEKEGNSSRTDVGLFVWSCLAI